MYLVQLLLPLRDSEGTSFPRTLYDSLARELTERFGGVTAYTRTPATGYWAEPSGHAVRDEVVVYETMVPELQLSWWRALRDRLEQAFSQDELVVRAHEIHRL